MPLIMPLELLSRPLAVAHDGTDSCWCNYISTIIMYIYMHVYENRNLHVHVHMYMCIYIIYMYKKCMEHFLHEKHFTSFSWRKCECLSFSYNIK